MHGHGVIWRRTHAAGVLALLFFLVAPAGVNPPYGQGKQSSLMQFTAGGHALAFSPEGVYAATGTHVLHVNFLSANQVEPQSDRPAPAGGQTAPLGRVTYVDLWDGISLTYAASSGSIYTTTYILSPGADSGNIRLRYNVPLTLNKNGTLSIAFEAGVMSESAPLAWQDIRGERVSVPVSFDLRDQEVSFALGAYDPSYPLTIDPSLTWNTFLGAIGDDFGFGIALDAGGNVYIAGDSMASWGAPVRTFTAGRDMYVAKLDSSGALVWNTFLGTSGTDFGLGLAVDASGNIYVAGASDTAWGIPLRAYTGNFDVFIAKLDPSGALTWNTFLGGSGMDQGAELAVDGLGNAYASGTSNGTWGAPVRAYTLGQDAFAAKLNSSGALIWNTFLGGGPDGFGSGDDQGTGIAVDGSGNVYAAGSSDAAWGSPVRVHTSDTDAFAAKLDSSGALTWNTFLGGNGAEFGWDVAVDGGGSVYVVGSATDTWGTPVRAFTPGAHPPDPFSLDDAFIAKLDPAGGLSWNTFLGGGENDVGTDLAIGNHGDVYASGFSTGSWGSPALAFGGGSEGFAAQVNSSGALTWSTFLGGSGGDAGYSIALDSRENVYVAGASYGTGWGAPVRPFTSDWDAFAAKLSIHGPTAPPVPAAAGLVTQYVAGDHITIQGADGSLETFQLSSETRILPPKRAGLLAVGSHVRIVSRRDPSTGSWIAINIVILPD